MKRTEVKLLNGYVMIEPIKEKQGILAKTDFGDWITPTKKGRVLQVTIEHKAVDKHTKKEKLVKSSLEEGDIVMYHNLLSEMTFLTKEQDKGIFIINEDQIIGRWI